MPKFDRKFGGVEGFNFYKKNLKYLKKIQN